MPHHPRLDTMLTPRGGLTIAFDHGFQGVPVGLEDARARVRDVLALGPDAIIAPVGLYRSMRDEITDAGAGLVGAIDAAVVRDDVVTARAAVTTVEQLARLGADAAKVLFQLDRTDEGFATEMEFIATVVREAEIVGLPVMIEPVLIGPEAPKSETTEAAEARVLDGCRIALELGADVLKAPVISVEAMKQMVENSYVPVVVLGGPAFDQEEFLRGLDGAMEAGVRGIAVGRNAWSGRDAVANVRAMREIVTNRNLEAALKIVREVN